ncbi:Prefoldin subunit-domain-containing protein [Hypoxylon sp. NC1633]|nr:Prefoldin subunit-domain-containing protein [Hypoxylon sp. NC1633]
MDSIKDSFLDLERHRQQLEENVERLSKALDHWKQWKTEYEALHADVKSLPSEASRQDLSNTREKFKGKLLIGKELVDIFGRDDSKKTEQIISTLTNRLDYVTKNTDTLGKQLGEMQNKLAAVTVIANPDATDEEGLPIMEIMEELDDDDNVVSFSLRTPGDSRPHVIEALQKAGITDLAPVSEAASLPDEQDSASISSKENPPPPVQQPKESTSGAPSRNAPGVPAQQPNKSQPEEKPKSKPTGKKRVAFAEDTKPDEQQKESATAKRLEEILQRARDQQSIISDPVIPADEPPEDAALREDMIRYNKETMEFEMAPIVAELQLEEGSTDTDNYSEYEDDDDEDDEDDWGRSKIQLDDDWKRQMLELKERLSNHTSGQAMASGNEGEMVEGLGRISIKRGGNDAANSDLESTLAETPNPEDPSPENDAKKTVRFAQSLDIAEEPAPAPTPTTAPPKQVQHPEVEPLSEVVMERNSRISQPAAPPTTKKASRFRQRRGAEAPASTYSNAKVPSINGIPIPPSLASDHSREPPSGPDGQTIADAVLEHEPVSEAKEPDEFDADLLKRQASEEYHVMRNRFVHRQGGFLREDERPVRPLDEDEGGPRRVSRFKAARLGRE